MTATRHNNDHQRSLSLHHYVYSATMKFWYFHAHHFLMPTTPTAVGGSNAALGTARVHHSDCIVVQFVCLLPTVTILLVQAFIILLLLLFLLLLLYVESVPSWHWQLWAKKSNSKHSSKHSKLKIQQWQQRRRGNMLPTTESQQQWRQQQSQPKQQQQQQERHTKLDDKLQWQLTSLMACAQFLAVAYIHM